MFQDKTIVCKDCGHEFTFTAREQEFFAEKGFNNEPQRCKPCKVPFQPSGNRPIYCSDCFRR